MNELAEDFDLVRPQPRLHRPSLAVAFNPKAWSSAHMMDITGPYAYALNMPQIAECKPGHLFTPPTMEDLLPCSAQRVPETAAQLASALHADGLFFHDMLPKHGHVLAFFSKPATKTLPAEILYARRDSNNLWSYREITEEGGCRKPYLPRQRDFAGKPIRDILKADFGRFANLLGFASIPFEGVMYYRRIVLPPSDMKPFHRAVPAEVRLEKR